MALPADKQNDSTSKYNVSTGHQTAETLCPYSAEEEEALLRKIDWVIVPLMCLVFFLQYLDKQALSYAAVFGLIDDLSLTSLQFSWSSSILFLGQLVSEWPFIYLMSRLPLPKLVGGTIVIWGIVCMCLATPRNFAGFATGRFLLGFFEGAVSPAFVSITSIWFRSHQHALRTAFWVSMNGFSQVIGSLIMYGIGNNDALQLRPWRVLFMVCGAMTIAAGVVFYFLMPVGPEDAWFLTAREKEMMAARMAQDREGGDKTSFSVAQFRETMLDVKSWLALFFGFLITLVSAPLTFSSLIIASLGYTPLQTILYTAPSGAVQFAVLWLGTLLCHIMPRNRTLVICFLCIIPLSGNALLLGLPADAHWALIVSAWLASCQSAVMAILLSLSASNVKGNTKRATVNAMFFIGFCVGASSTPPLWTHRPRYKEGVIADIVAWTLLFFASILYRFICMRDNNQKDKRERLSAVHRFSNLDVDDSSTLESDLTDKQDDKFRYSY